MPAPAGEGVAVDPWADGPPSLAEYTAAYLRRFETVDASVVTVLNQLWSELLAGDLSNLGAAATTYWSWVDYCPEWGRLPGEIREYAREDCRGFEHRGSGHAGLVAEFNTAVGGDWMGANAAVPSPSLPQPGRGWALLGFLMRKLNSKREPRWHDVWREFRPGEPIPSNELARRFLQDELQPLHSALVAHVTSLAGDDDAAKTKKSKTWAPPIRQDARRRWHQVDDAVREILSAHPDVYVTHGKIGRLTKAVKCKLPTKPEDAGSCDYDWLYRKIGAAYRHHYPRTGDDT